MKNPKIVVIGGGTGSFAVLSGLKKINCEITAIVSMVDDGGSSGILRDELGALPPGDIRQCLVALSPSAGTMRKLFNYRFRKGSLKGHSFGNLFLTSLEKITGNFKSAVQEASKILNIKGKVLPVTLDNTRLIIKLKNGKSLKGEKHLDSYDFSKESIKEVLLNPKAKINPEVKDALKEANVIIISPGTIYGSLVPNFLVSGFRNSLKKTKAKVIYVCNLMNIERERGYYLENYVEELEKYIGENIINFVLFNSKKPPKSVLERYKKKGEDLVKINKTNDKHYKIIKKDLISENYKKTAESKHLIRHDKEKLAKAILNIYERKLRPNSGKNRKNTKKKTQRKK